MTHTTVGIQDTDFTINRVLTYPGRTFDGHRIEGLLFNVRAVQATFDDANPTTRARWAYPDTGTWDATRNCDEFCAALPIWRAHGVLAFTINFQGGGPIYHSAVYDQFNNSAFTTKGDLKPDYADRFATVIRTADALGLIPIVGLFYGKHLQRLAGENALWSAADNALAFLRGLRCHNLLIELANELNVCWDMAGYEAISPQGAHLTLHMLRERFPMFLYGVSGGGMTAAGDGIPTNELIEASDFILLHGNGCLPDQLTTGIHRTQALPAYARSPKPLLINEDSIGIPNLDAAWRNHCSWGYYDQGYGSHWAWDRYTNYSAHPREPEYENLSGFQTPPINWTLNTNEKRAFFRRVQEITGA